MTDQANGTATTREPPPATADILVVDDNKANLQVLSDMLKEQGYRTRQATSGVAALRATRSRPPDLILLDVMMPEMNGYEVRGRLKSDEKLGDIPVIFLSELNETADKAKAFAAGGRFESNSPGWQMASPVPSAMPGRRVVV